MPNADRAVIDQTKVTDYCLNRNHPRGRHKARVFEAAMGLTIDNANDLIDALKGAAQSDTAELADADEYGERYLVEFEMRGPSGSGQVRSAWIVRCDEDFPRFVSCYVL